MSDNVKYLCFSLGVEEFAIPLLSVREVLGLPEVTPVPQTPTHFLGIMNLRGRVISVMDLRTKLAIKPAVNTETAVIILDSGGFNVGMVVDQVNSVQEILPEELAPKPTLESGKANEYVVGVYKKEDHLILMLDIARALSLEDKNLINNQKTVA